MKLKTVALVAVIVAGPFLAGCASVIKASEYKRSEVGEVLRAEPATVMSQRYVKIKGWRDGNNRSTRRNGINYVIKVDRTGETLSVTQSADVVMQAGAPVWVEFGDRIRLVPRS